MSCILCYRSTVILGKYGAKVGKKQTKLHPQHVVHKFVPQLRVVMTRSTAMGLTCMLVMSVLPWPIPTSSYLSPTVLPLYVLSIKFIANQVNTSSSPVILISDPTQAVELLYTVSTTPRTADAELAPRAHLQLYTNCRDIIPTHRLVTLPKFSGRGAPCECILNADRQPLIAHLHDCP